MEKPKNVFRKVGPLRMRGSEKTVGYISKAVPVAKIEMTVTASSHRYSSRRSNIAGSTRSKTRMTHPLLRHCPASTVLRRLQSPRRNTRYAAFCGASSASRTLRVSESGVKGF